MNTLGINAAFHDSSACLVVDGNVVAAAEEERFTQIKHGKRPVPFSAWELPYHAIDYCLAEADLHIGDVDHVAYSFAPELLVNGSGMPREITLPLIRHGLLGSWLLVFMIFEREYSTGVYLLAPGNEVIGASLVSLWQGGAIDIVAALSLVNIVLVAIGLAFALRFGVRLRD